MVVSLSEMAVKSDDVVIKVEDATQQDTDSLRYAGEECGGTCT